MKHMQEIWENIPRHEGWYRFSNFGNIISMKRKVVYKDGRIFNYPERLLKPQRAKNGYMVFVAFKNNIGTLFYIHRLIGMHFVPGFANGLCINHKDANKLNNNPDNLEWCTQSDNVKHAQSSGIMHKGESCKLSKLKEPDILNIRDLYQHGVTQLEISKLFNTGQDNISNIVNRKTWKHL